jgi:hypothetical protein
MAGFFLMRYKSELSDRTLDGVAALYFNRGRIIGVDSGGVQYEGTYADRADGGIEGSLILMAPAGTRLASGNRMDHPTEFAVQLDLPEEFANGEPHILMLQGQPVQAIFEKLVELPKP